MRQIVPNAFRWYNNDAVDCRGKLRKETWEFSLPAQYNQWNSIKSESLIGEVC